MLGSARTFAAVAPGTRAAPFALTGVKERPDPPGPQDTFPGCLGCQRWLAAELLGWTWSAESPGTGTCSESLFLAMLHRCLPQPLPMLLTALLPRR